MLVFIHLLIGYSDGDIYWLFKYLPQVAEAEEKTAGGLLLTEATKEKPSIGTVSFLLIFFVFEKIV